MLKWKKMKKTKQNPHQVFNYIGTLFASASFRTTYMYMYIILHICTTSLLLSAQMYYSDWLVHIVFCHHINPYSLKIASKHAKSVALPHGPTIYTFWPRDSKSIRTRNRNHAAYNYDFSIPFNLQKYPNLFLSGLIFY